MEIQAGGAQRMNAVNSKRRKKKEEDTQNDPTSPDVIADNQNQITSPNAISDKNGNTNDSVEGLTGIATTMSRELSSLNKRSSRLYSNNDSGNRIIHWDSLQSLISSNLVCKKCFSDISITETTVGIATEVTLTCKSCDLNEKNNVRRSDFRKHKFRQDSSESYALNCQFVLGLMQGGGGASEANVIITFLDLPHASTFQKNTYPRVQNAMRSSIKKITEHCMEKARDEEV